MIISKGEKITETYIWTHILLAGWVSLYRWLLFHLKDHYTIHAGFCSTNTFCFFPTPVNFPFFFNMNFKTLELTQSQPQIQNYSWNVAPSCSLALLHPRRALAKYRAIKFPLSDQKACIFVCLLTGNLLQTLIHVFRGGSRHKTEELKSESLLCNWRNVSFSVWSFLSPSVLHKTTL